MLPARHDDDDDDIYIYIYIYLVIYGSYLVSRRVNRGPNVAVLLDSAQYQLLNIYIYIYIYIYI